MKRRFSFDRVTITYIEYKNVIHLDRFGPPRIPYGAAVGKGKSGRLRLRLR